MSVEFDDLDQTFLARRVLGEYETPKILKWMKSKGLGKTHRGAAYILLYVSIAIVLVGAFLYWYNFVRVPPVPPEQKALIEKYGLE